MKVYDNPVGVLTNNPPFDYQMFNLNNYMHLAVANHPNTFSDELVLNPYSRGMGGMGLPGDLSSQSRFVRVSFVKMNSLSGDSEEESVSQFFSYSWQCGSAERLLQAWGKISMRLPYTPPAAIRIKESIIITPMIITRSAQWICTRKI